MHCIVFGFVSFHTLLLVTGTLAVFPLDSCNLNLSNGDHRGGDLWAGARLCAAGQEKKTIINLSNCEFSAQATRMTLGPPVHEITWLQLKSPEVILGVCIAYTA
ncbi:hypothetical protein BJ166DRAFT_529942 [Pestalotiopsis sp. NC0098]|nr:hypothetical protein BJ166DRAFT_529942 [Pestalotiopsis sp. NC0098]